MLNKLIQNQRYVYAFIFIAIAINLFILDQIKLQVNDDLVLFWFLSNFESGTLIMSYPLSYLIGILYYFMPYIQWLSLLYAICFIAYIYLSSIYIDSLEGVYEKVLLLVLLSVVLIYLLTNVSITSLTILIMILSLGFITIKFSYFLVFLFFAFLLREDIAIHFLPYIVVAIAILKPYRTFTKKDFFMVLIFLITTFASISVKNIDKDYVQWLQFNKARSMYKDLAIDVESDVLSSKEIISIRNWQFQDENMLPNKKLTSSTLSLSVKIEQVVNSMEYKIIANHRYRLIILFLFIVSIILVIRNYSLKKFTLYFAFVSGVILLIYIRDVDRTTIPLLLMWTFILYEDSRTHLNNYSKYFLLVSIVIYTYYIKPYQYFHNYNIQTISDKKNEAISLMKLNSIKCEPSIYFPMYFSGMSMLLEGNLLFDESNWMDSDDNLLLAGWPSRTNLFYKTHDITHFGVTRKYTNHYEYLMDDKTGFIGGKKKNSFLIKHVLNEYDKYYLSHDSKCKHQVYIIQESKFFSISQIKLACKE